MGVEPQKEESHIELQKKKQFTITITLDKGKILNIILGIALVVVLYLYLSGGSPHADNYGITANQVGQNVTNYINNNLVAQNTSASLVSIEDLGSIYRINTSYQGRDITVYATKDGILLFTYAYNITQQTVNPPTNQTGQIPKTDHPIVELYIMSFCPYGIQAEEVMKPVVELIGSHVTIQPHFIVSVNGTTVNSLHGAYEADEDIRQACIWKYYGQAVFWEYVDYFNNNCNNTNIETCWMDSAQNASVDTSLIDLCFTNEGLSLMRAEEALKDQNGVMGCPTLIINGVTYTGARTSEAYKQAICSAFNSEPSECSECLTCG